jgi:hypothetical protein
MTRIRNRRVHTALHPIEDKRLGDTQVKNHTPVCLSATKADADTGPSTPASSLFQKSAENTIPTIQPDIPTAPQARRNSGG